VSGGLASRPDGSQERLVLRSSRRKAVFLLASALLFVALGFLMGIGVIGFPGWLGVFARIVGWFALVFFGLAVPVALFQLLTNRSYLLLQRDGFQMYGIRKSRLIPWSDVEAFTAVTLQNPVLYALPTWIRSRGAPKMVLFDYRPGVQWHQGLRSFNRTFTGHDAGLAGTYGLKAEELAGLMNNWRSRLVAS
jgi:energy-coupling factor transporter transmembrane protein EcfT